MRLRILLKTSYLLVCFIHLVRFKMQMPPDFCGRRFQCRLRLPSLCCAGDWTPPAPRGRFRSRLRAHSPARASGVLPAYAEPGAPASLLGLLPHATASPGPFSTCLRPDKFGSLRMSPEFWRFGGRRTTGERERNVTGVSCVLHGRVLLPAFTETEFLPGA